MARKAPTAAAQRASLSIGETTIAAGTRTSLEIPVGRLPVGTWLSLPVEAVHGTVDGPTIWLNAAIHGDELNGVPTIRRALRQLDPTRLRGTVLAVPVVNVFGLINESRYLPDRRDLNRSFPGSARGSLAAQLAHLFMTEIVHKCELGIDCHTGADGRANLPQIRCDLDDPATRAAAVCFGAPVMVHSKLRDGSLRAAACARGIRVLLYEAGEASRFDRRSIECGVDGILRVMAHLRMVDALPDPAPPEPLPVRKSKWTRASRSGFLEMAVDLGARVDTGDVLARVYGTLDRKDTMVRASGRGIVIGHQTAALVHRGDAIVHVAAIDPS